MRSTKKLTALALTAAAATVLTACGGGSDDTAADGGSGDDGYTFAQDEDTLVWGVIPSEDASSLSASFDPVLEVVADETGKEVELFQATSYAAMIEAIMAGRVDVASLTSMPYVVALNAGAEIEPIAVGLNDKDVPSGYRAYGFAPAGSDVESIEDFAGKTICMVEPTSTSGGLYPTAALLDAGITPEEDAEVVWAGTHDAAVLNTVGGQCDVGFAYDTMITEILPEQDPSFTADDVEVVYESEIIPAAPVVVPTAMPEELRTQLADIFQTKANVEFLEENGYSDGSKIGDGPYWGYEEPVDGYYDPIIAVCETTQATECTDAG